MVRTDIKTKNRLLTELNSGKVYRILVNFPLFFLRNQAVQRVLPLTGSITDSAILPLLFIRNG
ncbi:hypothetical protein B1H10_06155 [candidate division KSB1 bacterium 4484_188]|nr:MAG: hypothetical protein B1H10_06155 [candidate division KSB1 bacterium 4484_188]